MTIHTVLMTIHTEVSASRMVPVAMLTHVAITHAEDALAHIEDVASHSEVVIAHTEVVTAHMEDIAARAEDATSHIVPAHHTKRLQNPT